MKSKNYWTAGNAMSWALGATLGVILGIALLIAIPRMMFPPASAGADAPQEPAAVATTADSGGASENAETAPAETMSKEGTTTAVNESGTESAASEDATTGGSEGMASDTEAAAGASTAAGEGNADAGKTFFAGSCAGCHGTEGQGGVGPALNNAAGWSDAEFTTAIREGKTPEKELAPIMPRFTEAQASAQQLADVHAYIKTLY